MVRLLDFLSEHLLNASHIFFFLAAFIARFDRRGRLQKLLLLEERRLHDLTHRWVSLLDRERDNAAADLDRLRVVDVDLNLPVICEDQSTKL